MNILAGVLYDTFMEKCQERDDDGNLTATPSMMSAAAKFVTGYEGPKATASETAEFAAVLAAKRARRSLPLINEQRAETTLQEVNVIGDGSILEPLPMEIRKPAPWKQQEKD